MLPLVGVPPTIAKEMAKYRDVFCRDEGFAHVCRYVTGLILSPNKTLQGIYLQLVKAFMRTIQSASHARGGL